MSVNNVNLMLASFISLFEIEICNEIKFSSGC